MTLRRPPRTLPYYEWSRIPWGYHLKMGGGRKTLLWSGVLTLALSHMTIQAVGFGTLASCGSFGNKNHDCGSHVAELSIPVVGPFLALPGLHQGEPTAAYPIFGASEVLGFLMILVGATLDEKRLVRDDRYFPLGSAAPARITPTLGPGQFGLGMRATF